MSDALLSPPASRHLRSPAAPPPLRRISSSSLFRFPLCRNVTAAFSISVARGLRETVGSHEAWWGDNVEDAPSSIGLVPISGEEQFDRVLADAHQLDEPLVIIWMANWCRKCIYLKPKLEKLAADYHPRMRFYYVDVNAVPQRLVSRSGITKMPTIQLWKDGRKQAEVIGGHKAWLVIDDVRRMIDDED